MRLLALTVAIVLAACNDSSSPTNHDKDKAFADGIPRANGVSTLLAMTDTTLFALNANQTAVVAIPKASGATTTIYTTQSAATTPISALAVSGQDLVACVKESDGVHVYAFPQTGGTAAQLAVFTASPKVLACRRAAAHLQQIYLEVIVDDGTGRVAENTSIYGLLDNVLTLLDDAADEDGLYADADRAYYLVYSADPNNLNGGEKVATVAPGGTPAVIGQVVSNTLGYSLAGGGAWLAIIDGSSIVVEDTAGNHVASYDDVDSAWSLATDGSSLVWSFAENSDAHASVPLREASIWVVDAIGDDPQQLTRGGIAPSDLMIDSDAIYWVDVTPDDASVKAVYRVAR